MPANLTIGPHRIGDDSDAFVIAEIGHNHQGSLETAMKLFKAAKECGAQAVKLQKRDNKALFTAEIYNAPYMSENSYGETYGEHREFLEFGREEFTALREYARELDILMFSTAFDHPSVDFLVDMDMPAFKIASGDLNNTPLLKHAASAGKPMIISTGGASLEDVRRAHDVIMPINPQLVILQCTAAYPCEPEDMNLRVIETFRREFPDAAVGLSDHQSGIAMATAAYVLGARVIEKHFTLNRAWRGTDHRFSLEPVGLRKLVRDLRRARAAMGDGVKRPLEIEGQPLFKMGKKLVAARDLATGAVLGPDDVTAKSPGGGLPPYELENLLGKKLKRALSEDQDISFDDLE